MKVGQVLYSNLTRRRRELHYVSLQGVTTTDEVSGWKYWPMSWVQHQLESGRWMLMEKIDPRLRVSEGL